MSEETYKHEWFENHYFKSFQSIMETSEILEKFGIDGDTWSDAVNYFGDKAKDHVERWMKYKKLADKKIGADNPISDLKKYYELQQRGFIDFDRVLFLITEYPVIDIIQLLEFVIEPNLERVIKDFCERKGTNTTDANTLKSLNQVIKFYYNQSLRRKHEKMTPAPEPTK